MADLVAYDDLDAFGTECATPVQELEQDLYHRTIEDPGSNPDDLDRGFGIWNRLSTPYDGSLGHDLELEYLKDDRVDSITVTVTPLDDDSGYQIDVDGIANGDALGFTMATTPAGIVVMPR